MSNSNDAAAVDGTIKRQTLTLGQLYARISALPPDARVAALSFHKSFLAASSNGQLILRIGSSRNEADRCRSAAAIVVRHQTALSGLEATATALEVAREIDPLLAQHADKPLITEMRGDVTDIVVVHHLVTPGQRSAMSKMMPNMARAYDAAVGVAKVLSRVDRVDDGVLHAAVEATLPEGLVVELYRVGDCLYSQRDLLARFPDLLVSQLREIFTKVTRDEALATKERGDFVLYILPDGITEAVLDAAFGAKKPLLDRLRAMAIGTAALSSLSPTAGAPDQALAS